MATPILNPAIEELDKESAIYALYTRLYDGMSQANDNEAPDFVSSPIYEINEDGSIKTDEYGAYIVDEVAIKESLASYSTILTKNAAYMFANAIISTIPVAGSGGEIGGSGYVSRNGDSMQGNLSALYGFSAGFGNDKVFETSKDFDDNKVAYVYGKLNVSGDSLIDGSLTFQQGDEGKGIYFGENKAIWHDGSSLHISSESLSVDGDVVVDGSISVGDLKIDGDGLKFGDSEFYHSGNSNKSDVSWTMFDGNVYGNLNVHGTSAFGGSIEANNGFSLGVSGNSLMYSSDNDSIILDSDLSIANGHGIKLDDKYIVSVREGVVSFSAPGAILSLGDSVVDEEGNKTDTQYIALQSDIKNHNGAYNIITHDGSGNFPNGFSAGAANSLGATFQTYYASPSDYGVVVKNNLRLGGISGPSLYGEGNTITYAVPYEIVVDSGKKLGSEFLYGDVVQSSSIIHNPLGSEDVMAFRVRTSAKHLKFDSPVEVASLSIKSNRYKTILDENTLFFDEDKFIEGVETGIRFSQNSMFDGGLFSYDNNSKTVSFSSGFAGNGWAIMNDATVGGVHATFDSLTIRKKMRVYELEVQKTSAANGALWISDYCSGDEVRVLN